MSRTFQPLHPALSRRHLLAGAAAWVASAAIAPALGQSLGGFIDTTWSRARAKGVSRRTFDAAMGGFRPLDSVLKLSRSQPEFVSTAADYIGKRVTDGNTVKGRSMRGEWAQTLGAITSRYGVQAEAMLAIWGIETNYGGFMGGTNSVHALASLSYSGYRADYFGSELITALQILEAGHVTHDRMVGSWAGAMGHPQFMPSSFMRYAVDFKGDGREDIWNSVPDALASIANYLKEHGWRPGETWGYEVKLPVQFNYNNVWNKTTASLADWRGLGVRRTNGRDFPRPGDAARLYMPMGGNGPVFAVLANFDVIKRYNNSDSYALAVGHLADRIIGGGTFAAPWPKDTALNKSDRQQVQTLLLRRGYDIGSPDGIIGPKTRAAVIDWQSRSGLVADGHVSGRLLDSLS